MWSRFISSSLKLTQTEKNKHVEFENDFHELIAVTFTSSSGRKREIIEKGSSERIPYQMKRRDDCVRVGREKVTRGRESEGIQGRFLRNTWSVRWNATYQSVSRELYPLSFFLLSSSLPSFFSTVSAHPSCSIHLSLVREDSARYVFSQQTFRRSVSM